MEPTASEGLVPPGPRTSRRGVVLVLAVVVVAVAAAGAIAWWRHDGGRVRTVRIEAAEPGGDGRSLVVRYLAGSPGCGDPLGVAVKESATEVRLTARVEYTKGDGVPCPLVARRVTETVRLSGPLGERAVVDASSGERVG